MESITIDEKKYVLISREDIKQLMFFLKNTKEPKDKISLIGAFVTGISRMLT